MQPEGQTGEPDAALWRDNAGQWGIACSRCDYIGHTLNGELGEAHKLARGHLRFRHGLRRVWVEELETGVSNAIQLALPILMDGQARAQERAVYGPTN